MYLLTHLFWCRVWRLVRHRVLCHYSSWMFFTIFFLHWFWIAQYITTKAGHKPDRSIWTTLQWTHCPSTHKTPAFHPIQVDDAFVYSAIIRNGQFCFSHHVRNVTSYASQTLLKIGSNRALCPGPYSVKMVKGPEINNEENWQCFYGTHKATIFMKSFVQIHSIVERPNTMYYLAWNLNGWISSSPSSSSDKTNPSTGQNVWWLEKSLKKKTQWGACSF